MIAVRFDLFKIGWNPCGDCMVPGARDPRPKCYFWWQLGFFFMNENMEQFLRQDGWWLKIVVQCSWMFWTMIPIEGQSKMEFCRCWPRRMIVPPCPILPWWFFCNEISITSQTYRSNLGHTIDHVPSCGMSISTPTQGFQCAEIFWKGRVILVK